MAHLKLTPPFNVVGSPKFAKAQARSARPDGPAPGTAPQSAPPRGGLPRGAEDASLAEIAQRFAPGAQAAAAAQASSPSPASGHASLNTPLGAFKALPQALQGLILALVLIALLPSLTLTALVWIGPAGLPGFAQSDGGAPVKTVPVKTLPVKTASLADLPLGAGDQPPAAPVETAAAETADAGQASLAAPSMLEAEAGQEAPLAIALASVEPLPIRSVVAVSGLPPGATLSAGRPYTDAEWNLRPEELGGLRLILPDNAQGEARLEIALIATDGARLAEAETALKVIAAPASPGTGAIPEAANGAAAPHAPSPASLAPAYDPFTAPAIADLAALAPQGQASETPAPGGLAPEGLAPEGQAPEAAQTQATAAVAEDAEAGDASEPTSVPASAPLASGSLASEPGTGPATGPFANASPADAAPSVALSEFVNLREGPTSSSRVIAVIAKGAKVTPTARKRSWLKVTDAATGKTGWIYGRYASAADQGSGRTGSPSRLGPGPDESFLTRMGRWIVY